MQSRRDSNVSESSYNLSTKNPEWQKIMKLQKAHSYRTMAQAMDHIKDNFKTALTLEFDVFQFSEDIGRKHCLPYLIVHLFDSLPRGKEENFGQLNE